MRPVMTPADILRARGKLGPYTRPDTAARMAADVAAVWPADTDGAAAAVRSALEDVSLEPVGRGFEAAARELRPVDSAAVRAWAAEHGIDVPRRGPVPAVVLDAYRQQKE